MSTMQEKLMRRIHATIDNAVLECALKFEGVEAWHFSNSGTVHVQRRSDCVTRFRIVVQFNPTYATLGIVRNGEGVCNGCAYGGDGKPDVDPERKRSFYHLEYEDAARVTAFFDALTSELERAKQFKGATP